MSIKQGAIKPLLLNGNDTNPYVNFNHIKGEFRIGGVAIPEDVLEMFNPIINWLTQYSKAPREYSEFEFYFEYLNTSATKMIFDICGIINKMADKNISVIIKWLYNRGDIEMYELGEEVLSLIDCPSKIIPVDSDFS